MLRDDSLKDRPCDFVAATGLTGPNLRSCCRPLRRLMKSSTHATSRQKGPSGNDKPAVVQQGNWPAGSETVVYFGLSETHPCRRCRHSTAD